MASSQKYKSNCDKCWPKIKYDRIQHISHLGSSASTKMQVADRIKHASKHRGRCSKQYIPNPASTIIPPAITNIFTTPFASSNGRKR